jgi:alanine racemase
MTKTVLERLAWAEIDLGSLRSNVQAIQEVVGEKTKIMAVVKANAYGHGAIEVGKAALDSGAVCLGVSSLVEAKQLRSAGIRAPVVILGYTPAENYLEIVDQEITPTIRSVDVAKSLLTAARRREKSLKIWVKVDTGMHRLGLDPEETLYFLRILKGYPNLELEGLFTHFATSDEDDLSFSNQQLSTFNKLLAEIKKEGIDIPLVSAANSAATFKMPESRFDLVRVGMAMYGFRPDKNFDYGVDLKPILTFKTQITQLTEIPKGDSVGYGRQFLAQRPTLVATLAVGYGDGFRRTPKNWGEVLIHGQRAPLIGRVAMDQAAIDVTDVKGDVRRGDEVTLIGKDGQQTLSVEDVAESLETIPYEVVTGLSGRVERIYKN